MNLKLPAILCALFVTESNAMPCTDSHGCGGPPPARPCGSPSTWCEEFLQGFTSPPTAPPRPYQYPQVPERDRQRVYGDGTPYVYPTKVPLPEGWRRLDALDITEHYSNCNSEIYQISVVTTGSSKAHIALVANPQCNELEGESCTCPLLSFDTGAYDNGNLDNAIHVMTGAPDEKESLNLGSFSLLTILDAFTAASVKNSGTEYDFLVNNCASFIISMGLELGINPSDTKIISFMAQHISSKFILKQLLEVDHGKIKNTNERMASNLVYHGSVGRDGDTDIYDSQIDAVVVEEFIVDYIREHTE